MIFRDDDISAYTDLEKFHRVQKVFDNYGVTHTIAVLTKDMETRPDLVAYIKDHGCDVQLHGWTHIKFTLDHSQVIEQLQRGIDDIYKLFGTRPSTFYPPWNDSDQFVEKAASSMQLQVSNKKTTLSKFIQSDGRVDEFVVNFHYWADQEAMMIEPALRIYKAKN